VLEQLYTSVFAKLPPIHSILDVACGLNPLALPWMSLPAGATYNAIDIYEDLMLFLQEFIELCGYAANTRAQSVLDGALAEHKVDLALVLKAIPCLEQADKQAARRLLDRINADHLLVSFPVHSLGGRSKGMSATYETHFVELVKDRPWSYQRFEFATELVFLVTRSA
jgi:16S rRNA (guanine(1405)-N(7))-methyltransferase